MARRRKKRTLKPRTPARIRKRKRARSRGGHQHAELVGLGLAAAGVLLLTGASVGAVVRRSGHAVRRAGGAARRHALAQLAPELPAPAPATVTRLRTDTKPIDAVHDFPDVVGETFEPAPLLVPDPQD